jgi:hypothetical protein
MNLLELSFVSLVIKILDELTVARTAAAFFHLCIDAVCELFLAFARVADLFYVLVSEAVADTHNHKLS